MKTKRALLFLLLLTPTLAVARDGWEISCYWSVDELYVIFNGVASIMKSAGFASLNKTSMLFATMAVLLGTMWARSFVIVPWFMSALLIFTLLNVPIATVIIKDKTGGQPEKIVDNVPALYAATASFVTLGGDFFTRAFETSYLMLPTIASQTSGSWDKLSFRDHDLGFGHRLLRESQKMRIADPILQADMVYFTRDCINAGFAEGKLDYTRVFKGNDPSDTWNYIIDHVNKSRLTTYHDAAQNVKIEFCQNVAKGGGGVVQADSLNTRLTTAITNATAYYGKKFNANDVTGSIFAGSLANAYGVMLNSSMSASDIIKQNMFINLYEDSDGAIGRMMNDPSAVQAAYAKAQAVAMTNSSYVTQAAIAEQTMPRMRNMIEMIVYALFPVVAVIMMVAGHQSLPVFKGWVMALVQVNLWPPIYAVVNFIGTVKTVSALTAKAALSGGLSIQTADMIGTTVISDQALMGYLVLLVPPIAYMVTKGMTDISGNWLATAMKSAQVAGAGAASGNINQGNVSMDNASANKVDMSGSYADPMRYEQVTASGWKNTFTGDGGHIMDGSKTVDNYGAIAIKGGSRLAASAQRQSEAAETAAVGNMQSYAETTAASLQRQAGFEQVRGAGARAGVHDGVGQGSSRGQGLDKVLEDSRKWGAEHKLDQGQATRIQLLAEAGGGTPKMSPVQIKAAASIAGTSEAKAAQLLSEAHNFNEKTGFATKVDTAIKAAHDTTFDTTNESSRRGTESIRGGYDQGQQALDQASANYQKSRSYKETAAEIRENSASIDRNLNKPFRAWLANQDDGNGQKLGQGGASRLITSGSTLIDGYSQQFLQEEGAKELHRMGVRDPGTPKDVREFHHAGAAGVKGANQVAGQGAQWQAAAGAQAANAGVNPQAPVTSNVPQQAAQQLAHDSKDVAAGQAKVVKQGAPLKQEAETRTQPGSQHLTGLAATNAVAQVTPDSASGVMLKKIPGIDTSVGTPGAAVAEASAARAEKNKKDW